MGGIRGLALAWSRLRLAEESDRWWTTVDRIAALPARAWAGMRIKAEVIHQVCAPEWITIMAGSYPPSAVRGSVGVVTMHQTQRYAFQRVLTQHQRRVQRRVILKVAGVIAGLLTAFLALGQVIP